MDIRFYTAQMINPTIDKGVIEVKNAPFLTDATGPEHGLLGYHKASALSIASRNLVVAAIKNKSIFVTLDITVANLRSEDDHGNKLKIASMKPEEVKFCEVIHLGRLTASLRQNMIDIFKSVAVTAEQKVMLANIYNDEPFKEYIKKNPSVIDTLRNHDDFKHIKVIIYPSGGPDTTEFMVSLNGVEPDNVFIRPIGPVKGVEFKVPSSILNHSNEAVLFNRDTPQLTSQSRTLVP